MFSVPKFRRASRGHGEINFLLYKIKSAHTLVLALQDEPYPYAVAVNYAPKVCDDELYLIFHGAKEGRRFNLLKKNPKNPQFKVFYYSSSVSKILAFLFAKAFSLTLAL